MGKSKKVPLAIAGTVLGILALRALRERRSESTDAEPRETEQEDPESATEHAMAAVEHTRQAAEKTKGRLPRTTT